MKPMNMKNQAISVLSGMDKAAKEKSPQGWDARFVPITDRWAVKVFRNADIRDSAYHWQHRAALHQLGPLVGDYFDLGKEYCYITEIAEPALDVDAFDWSEEDIRLQEEFRNELDELIYALKRIGFGFGDVHMSNVGWLNGRLVCIDFGDNFS